MLLDNEILKGGILSFVSTAMQRTPPLPCLTPPVTCHSGSLLLRSFLSKFGYWNRNELSLIDLSLYSHRVLQMSDGIHNMGDIRLELFGFLALAWVIVYFCLWKGVATTGKVVYITATLPIILLFTFVIRGVTLPGAMEGLKFFFLPNWHKVCEPKVWINAASQVLIYYYLTNVCETNIQGFQFYWNSLWFSDSI